jgi:hypothetical protein
VALTAEELAQLTALPQLKVGASAQFAHAQQFANLRFDLFCFGFALVCFPTRRRVYATPKICTLRRTTPAWAASEAETSGVCAPPKRQSRCCRRHAAAMWSLMPYGNNSGRSASVTLAEVSNGAASGTSHRTLNKSWHQRHSLMLLPAPPVARRGKEAWKATE